MKNNISVSNQMIGPGEPCFLIAEVGQAHDGSLGIAHSYIDAIADTGFNAIKFQTHIATAESTIDEQFRIPFSYEDKCRYDYWQRMEFTLEQWAGLKQHADERGIFFFSSVFSLESVELLNKIGVEAWKIGSGELSNIPLLSALALTGKPVLLSTGMSSWQEIDAALEIIQQSGSEFAIFQCTSKYPAGLDSIGLNILTEMLERYSCPVGLSDHSGSIFPSLLAMARGANLIEIHAVFHRKMFGPDSLSSLQMIELKQLKEARDAFSQIDSNPVNKDLMASQLDGMRQLFTKSVTLKSSQRAGTLLTEHVLTTKKPGTGISADDLPQCIGRILKQDTPANRLLTWDDLE